jgi:dinuclear metal center YbgI/SA1388 family protein
MECCVGDVADAIETLAPPDLAAAWDNAGLQVGNTAWPVHLIWVALDPLPEVVSSACKADVDLLVTHHPLLFRPLKRVDAATPQGAMIALALKSDMAIYAAHTNLDAAAGGINDMLASKIGLEEVGLYTETLTDNNQHLVRIGRLPKKKSLILLARELKKSLDVHALKIAGDPNLEVSKVFLCSGSGSSLLPEFMVSGMDVFISGDLKYHDARAIEMAGKGAVDIGHFASEHLMIEGFSDRLARLLRRRELDVTVTPYRHEKDPFVAL